MHWQEDENANNQVIPETRYFSLNFHGKDISIAARTRRNHMDDNLIVFLHGLGCSQDCFTNAFSIEQLSKYAIVTFDFVGHGKSDKPVDFSYGLEDQAAIARLLIARLSPQKVHIVGHSMGGAVGTLLAQEMSDGVFINAEGNLVAEDCYLSGGIASHTEEYFLNQGHDQLTRNLMESGEPALSMWPQWFRDTSPLGLYRSAQSLVRWSESGKLLDIFNRLARKSYLYSDKSSPHYLFNQLQNTTLHKIENSGHFMMIDNFRDFYRIVANEIG